MLCTIKVDSACVRILWKLRQQRGLKMVLAYVTDVLVKVNMFRTRCMLFYFAKTIEFVSWGNIFVLSTPFLRTFQQPHPFCCKRSTTNLFMISFLCRTIDFFFFYLSLWIYLWLADTSQQPISQTTWLKVTPHCNHYGQYRQISSRSQFTASFKCLLDSSIAERFSGTAWVWVVCTSCSNWACYFHARVYCRFEA